MNPDPTSDRAAQKQLVVDVDGSGDIDPAEADLVLRDGKPVFRRSYGMADLEHAVCLIDPQGRATVTTLAQSPEAIDEWASELASRFPGQNCSSK